LDAAGETNFDVSRAPNNVYPYLDWRCGTLAGALKVVLEQIGCTVVLSTINPQNPAVVYPINDPSENPVLADSEFERNPVFQFTTGCRPQKLVLCGGPIRFQTKLLLEAVGMDTDGQIKLIDDLSYKPAGGWERQWFLGFVDVPIAQRHLALETVWRWYRVKTVIGLPGIPAVFTPASDVILDDILAETIVGADGLEHRLPARLEGSFWHYGDLAGNSYPCGDVTGKFTIDKNNNVVKLHYPLIRWLAGRPTAATLYLTTSFFVRDGASRKLVSYRRERILGGGGSGDKCLSHPEIWDVWIQRFAGDSCVALGNVETRTNAANAEADAILALQDPIYGPYQQQDVEYASLKNVPLNGHVAQVHWNFGVGRDPLTRASKGFEFDVYHPSERERGEQVDLRESVQQSRANTIKESSHV
jgi:hypothetical protein